MALPKNSRWVKHISPWRVKLEQLVGNVFESNPDLKGRLEKEGISNLVICGIQSDCCVRASSLGALMLGFNVTVLSGAHSTYPSGGKSIEAIKKAVEHELEGRSAKVMMWDVWSPKS